MNIKNGDTLTIKNDIITLSGLILFKKGQKVKIRDIEYREPFYGKGTGFYYPKKISVIKLEDHYGVVFLPHSFVELNNNNFK